jgi:DNA gyrase subunit B
MDSAAGTVKNARNPIYQAVLPLRGKVLNVQKVDIDKALENQEIQDMITAIGTGILDDFDITSLNYDKIILCSDADVNNMAYERLFA